MGYPIDKIVDKLLRDLGEEISKVVILKALPEEYLRSKNSNRINNDSYDLIEGHNRDSIGEVAYVDGEEV